MCNVVYTFTVSIEGPTIEQQIAEAVHAAMAGFGMSGRVVVRERTLELHGTGAPIVFDLDTLPVQWPLLPPEMRKRKVEELVRRMQTGRNSLAPKVTQRRLPKPVIIAVPFSILLVLVGALLLWKSHKAQPLLGLSPEPSASVSASPVSRSELACEATRRKVFSGATVTALDAEGWIVEVWLGQERGEQAAPPLPAGSRGVVFDASTQVVELGAEASRGLFDPSKRGNIVAVADALATSSGARWAALLARCAHLPHRDVGAWFWGRDSEALAVAMLFGLGHHAEAHAVDHGKAPPTANAALFFSLASGLTADAIASVSVARGARMAQSEQGISLTFPASGHTQALSATRQLGQGLGK